MIENAPKENEVPLVPELPAVPFCPEVPDDPVSPEVPDVPACPGTPPTLICQSVYGPPLPNVVVTSMTSVLVPGV